MKIVNSYPLLTSIKILNEVLIDKYMTPMYQLMELNTRLIKSVQSYQDRSIELRSMLSKKKIIQGVLPEPELTDLKNIRTKINEISYQINRNKKAIKYYQRLLSRYTFKLNNIRTNFQSVTNEVIDTIKSISMDNLEFF